MHTGCTRVTGTATIRVRLTAFMSLAVCLGSAACDGEPAADAQANVAVHDSAGVRLVHNLNGAADTAAWQLVEELRIGVVDGAAEYQFFRVASVATDADGRIFVADEGDHAVRVFDRDGRFVRGFGRPGQGPGEFTRPTALFLRGDTVHVTNFTGSASRSVLFDTTGTLLTTLPQLLPNGSSIAPLAAGPAGWLVYDDSLLARRTRERAGDVTHTFTVIARVAPEDLVRVTGSRAAADSLLVPVVTYPRGRIFWALGSEGGSAQFPLGNPPFYEPAPANAVDARGFVHVAHGWPYAISTYDTAGSLVRRISRAHDSIPVDQALLGEVMRRVRAYYDTLGNAQAAMLTAYTRRAEFPRIGYVPVTSTVHASSDGWLWVRRPDLEPDRAALAFALGLPPRPSYWDVFDDDGVYRHTLQLPPRFVVRSVTPTSVTGVLRDELDVPYIVRFGVRPRSPSDR
jgi:hypothetical protein